MYKDTGADLTSSYVENSVVELREGSVDGPLKSFSAVISSTRKLITITPDSDLKDDTVYYVIVNKEEQELYEAVLEIVLEAESSGKFAQWLEEATELANSLNLSAE